VSVCRQQIRWEAITLKSLHNGHDYTHEIPMSSNRAVTRSRCRTCPTRRRGSFDRELFWSVHCTYCAACSLVTETWETSGTLHHIPQALFDPNVHEYDVFHYVWISNVVKIVKSVRGGLREFTQVPDRNGYSTVPVIIHNTSSRQSVHRLVMAAFYPTAVVDNRVNFRRDETGAIIARAIFW
jgi:hypothetical protein